MLYFKLYTVYFTESHILIFIILIMYWVNHYGANALSHLNPNPNPNPNLNLTLCEWRMCTSTVVHLALH